MTEEEFITSILDMKNNLRSLNNNSDKLLKIVDHNILELLSQNND